MAWSTEKKREYLKAYRAANRERAKELAAAWYARNPDYGRRPEVKTRRTAIARKHLLKKRGMTKAEFDRSVAAQAGKCPICSDTPRSLVIDHCHETNKTRGLICTRCNSLLGFARDREDVLLSAIDYLKKRAA